MSKLVLINAQSLEKILFILGFINKRHKGSHRFYRHKDGRYTTIPFHGNKDLSRPLLSTASSPSIPSMAEATDQLRMDSMPCLIMPMLSYTAKWKKHSS